MTGHSTRLCTQTYFLVTIAGSHPAHHDLPLLPAHHCCMFCKSQPAATQYIVLECNMAHHRLLDYCSCIACGTCSCNVHHCVKHVTQGHCSSIFLSIAKLLLIMHVDGKRAMCAVQFLRKLARPLHDRIPLPTEVTPLWQAAACVSNDAVPIAETRNNDDKPASCEDNMQR